MVSVQFALHYAFESEVKVRQTLSSVSKSLIAGGTFFGTIPNSRWIVKKLRNSSSLEFGNSIYNVRFEQKSDYPIYGHKYWFQLEDAIDDCPEYLIHQPSLVSLAKEYGLRLLLLEPFHEFYEYEKRDGADLLDRMKVFNAEGTISRDEWEAIGIYCTFAFEKI